MPKAGKHLIVIHHAHCIDGEASRMVVTDAWAAQRRAQGRSFDFARDVKNIAYKHHAHAHTENKILLAAQQTPGADIVFVDVAPHQEFLEKLRVGGAGRSIRVIDHHPGELENYKAPASPGLPSVKIDIDTERTSATRLAWDLLRPGRKAPPLVNMINRMDIDAPGLITQKQIAAAAYIDHCYNNTPHETALETLQGLTKMTFNEMARRGRPLAAEQEAHIKSMLKTVRFAELQILPGEKPVLLPLVQGDLHGVGRPISRRLVSLGKQYGTGIAASWQERQHDHSVTVSLRSDGTPDANRVARHLSATGGGHRRCAAAHFASMEDFREQIRFVTQPRAPASPAPARGFGRG